MCLTRTRIWNEEKNLNLIPRTLMDKNITSIIMRTQYNLRLIWRIIYRGGNAPVHCLPAIQIMDASREGYRSVTL